MEKIKMRFLGIGLLVFSDLGMVLEICDMHIFCRNVSPPPPTPTPPPPLPPKLVKWAKNRDFMNLKKNLVIDFPELVL